MARANRKPTTDAVDILHHRYFEGKPEMLALLEEERVNADLAQKVYDLRTAAGLTQRELAERVGTKPSVICRLEDADYRGHSLTMLQRIAAAVGRRVEVIFVPHESSPLQADREGRAPEPVRKRPAKKYSGGKGGTDSKRAKAAPKKGHAAKEGG
jgi:transcriptional regulator with XRE-family HTH domain